MSNRFKFQPFFQESPLSQSLCYPNRITAVLLGFFITIATVISFHANGQETKILLIGKKPDHPFGTHMYLHTCKVLAKCLSQTPNVQTVISAGWPKDPEMLKGVKTIVIYSTPAAEFLLDGPHRAEVDRLMKSGVGIVTLHWASSIFQQNLDRLGDRWLSYMGGTWVHNVGLSTTQSTLKQLLPKHPVCRGWQGFDLLDEYYLNPRIVDAKPLLQVHTNNQNVVVGWVYQRKDGGRAFATTLGHYYRNFQNDSFRKMIINGILWSAHVEIPKEGAAITLSKNDLALPAKPAAKAKK